MDLKAEFTRIATDVIHRNGLTDLMAWLERTDFYTAPASTRYHGAFEGGLVMHSLNVYHQLKKLCGWYCPDEIASGDLTLESIAIVSLFHDLCKVGFYKTEKRWRKDVNDRWEQYDTWKHDEDFAFGGHGSKSVFLVMNFMKLTPDEAAAINCHMGQFDATQYSNPSTVYSRNKLAWLLHVADEAATYIDEKED
jgi:hypothetical protein